MNKSNGLQYLIIVLLIANLCGTFWLIAKNSPDQSQKSTQTDQIEKSEFIKQFDRVIAVYNEGDQEEVWNLFSDFAKAQMNKESFVTSVLSLQDMFGTIQDGTFMYQEPAGKKGNLSFYKGFFSITLKDSKIGEKASLVLTVSSDGSITELAGFHLNSNT